MNDHVITELIDKWLDLRFPNADSYYRADWHNRYEKCGIEFTIHMDADSRLLWKKVYLEFLNLPDELEKQGYEPCNRHLNIYPDDFTDLSVWDEVLQCLGLESSDGVTLAVAGIKDEREKDTAPVDENEKIIRAWNDDDDYVLKVKTVLGNIERSTLKANAINSISGSYAIAEITDLSTDVFDDETEVEVDNFHLDIKYGVKSDCESWTSIYFKRLNCETLELSKPWYTEQS